MKSALITGITGQDGSFLAELLLEKSYRVLGLVSSDRHIDDNLAAVKDKIQFFSGNLQDHNTIGNLISEYQPTELYNLGGLSYPPASWDQPTLTFDINLLGLSRILESVRLRSPHTKIYQASSSKIFGNPTTSPQTETTPLNPLDPYSASKAAAHQLAVMFRSHFNLFICSGIMYNHESTRRDIEFVTRKITHTAAAIKLNQTDKLVLGDLDATADWGYAPDYVEAMWLMLQHHTPDDYIIASGQAHAVRDICQIAFSHLELDYTQFVTTDPKFIRQEKITSPLGDYSKAKNVLNWQPTTSFKDMIINMVEHDLKIQTNNLP